ncbi:DUF6708 domain-containing protein [Pseudomonas sp. Teo4]|uniref:DUF6708 domain-containing protein n=1 Tax=Pseudomonas sp. Teo4 TaxID=3064528 RepID=UPI002AB857E9|nr:DUF6708 domain-containing protein [Pseudomonas sp. Teo4]MDZ3992340.1 hypothetical protein [Pseudomonas sp. Teo4]
MSVLWLFSTKKDTGTVPKISYQVHSITKESLCLRNPWVSDSVLMGKLYTASILLSILYIYPNILSDGFKYNLYRDKSLLATYALAPFLFAPFLAYRIFFIKNLSNIYLNRETKKIHYQRIRTLISFDWNNVGGGVFSRTEFSGSAFSTSYALAFAPRRADGTLHKKDCLWVDSNEPTESDIKYVAEVWEYLRHFMDHGPEKLPPPGDPSWLYRPLHEICLTPAQAWRHYAPWRTGEPGEMQGKKLWLLPFWAVLFPYNLSVAICWYLVCRLFNVRAAPPPPEAFEKAPPRPKKRKTR